MLDIIAAIGCKRFVMSLCRAMAHIIIRWCPTRK